MREAELHVLGVEGGEAVEEELRAERDRDVVADECGGNALAGGGVVACPASTVTSLAVETRRTEVFRSATRATRFTAPMRSATFARAVVGVVSGRRRRTCG